MNTMRLFPSPLPGETILSLITRYHRVLGAPAVKGLMNDLFGHPTKTLMSEVPSGLGCLEDSTGIRGLIENHTLFPLFSPFIGPDRALAAHAVMTSNSGTGLKMSLGITAAGFGRYSALRFCTQCVEADSANLGIGYWHVIHQASGMQVCPVHQCALWRVVLKAWDNPRCSLWLPGDVAIQERCEPYILSDQQLPRVGHLAELMSWGQDNPDSVSTLLSRRFLFYRLNNLGLMSAGRIRAQALLDYILRKLTHYPNAFEFQRLGIQSAHGLEWPFGLLRKRARSHHPLLFYLMLDLLDIDFSHVNDFLLSGCGYHQATPSTDAKPVLDADVVKVLERRRLFCLRDRSKPARAAADYIWLYRHDRSWLSAYLKTQGKRPAPKARVDWDGRDRQLTLGIHRATQKIMAMDGKPIKITPSALARHLGEPMDFLRQRARLPRAVAALQNTVETEHDFQLRKVIWAEKYLRDQGIFRGVGTVLRTAGIRVCVLTSAELSMLHIQPQI